MSSPCNTDQEMVALSLPHDEELPFDRIIRTQAKPLIGDPMAI